MTKYIEFIRSKLDERTLLEQLAEESAELTQATLKLIRAMGSSNNVTPVGVFKAWENFREELRDLELCLVVFGEKEHMSIYAAEKLKRWAERLGYKDE